MFKQTRLVAEKIKTQQKKRTRIEDVLDTKENEEMIALIQTPTPYLSFNQIQEKERETDQLLEEHWDS